MNYIAANISEEIKKDYLTYAISTANRAIPSSIDGLKQVQRRIIFTMLEDKLVENTKTLKISGKVAGIHPHGDCGAAIQNLANVATCLNPLLDMQGSMGGVSTTSRQIISDDNAASTRYTGNSLNLLAQKLFDLDKSLLNQQLTYDGSTKEVAEYCPALPLALLNAQNGIGVGYASNTASFVAKNIVKAILNINDENATIKALGYPDFAHNTNIVKSDEIIKLHQEGRGSISLLGSWQINNKEIVITKLAIGSPEKFCNAVKSALELERITGIAKLVDLSSKEICIKIVCKKAANPEIVLASLLNCTNLQATYAINNVYLINSIPQLCTPYQLLRLWYARRTEVLLNKFNLQLAAAQEQLALKSTILSLYTKLKEIAYLVINSDSAQQAQDALISSYSVSPAVAAYLLNLSLKQLTKLQQSTLITEINELKADIFKLNLLVTNPAALHAEIYRQADDCLQFCAPRVSQVIDNISSPSVKTPIKRAKKLTKQEQIFARAAEIAKSKNIRLPRFNGLKNSLEEQLFEHLVLHLFIRVTKGYDKRKLAKMNLEELRAILKNLNVL